MLSKLTRAKRKFFSNLCTKKEDLMRRAESLSLSVPPGAVRHTIAFLCIARLQLHKYPVEFIFNCLSFPSNLAQSEISIYQQQFKKQKQPKRLEWSFKKPLGAVCHFLLFMKHDRKVQCTATNLKKLLALS